VQREITSDIAVLQRLVAPAGQDILDVGCGKGVLVRELCARGARARGMEISEDQLAPARAQDPDDPDRFLVGRAEQLPLADASLDVVVFMRALHHIAIDQMTAALSEARRVLRATGTVYIAEPLPEGSFFELTCLVEDEREVRLAAQAALDNANQAGLRRLITLEYAVQGRYRDVAAFRAHMLGVDPNRAGIFAERASKIADAFAQLGQAGAASSERRFTQPMRVDVLQADGLSP
jgi:ubiquinone/menaquinone biosynthesis C-methylase UbiE